MKDANSKEKKIFNFLNVYNLYLFYNDSLFCEAVPFKGTFNFPDGGTIARKLHIKNSVDMIVLGFFLVAKKQERKRRSVLKALT